MKLLPFVALFAAHAAGATGLDDMKAALAGLQGQGTLRGTYEARQVETDLDAKAKGPETTSVAVAVEDDAGAVALRWDKALLKRAADEAAKRPKPNNALLMLINSTSGAKVAAAVNYAPKLLQTVAHSQLVSEKADTYQGKPARLLLLAITPAAEENSKVNMKENTHTAQVWIGADGLPLAATVTHKIKASFMVFISFEDQSREELVFNVAANRLVVVKREEQGARKGAGNDSSYRNTYTFTTKA
ncbi:hypothetical protein E4L96_16065 [Massilia arenosa]|uniref:Uncharacterized protein n=1 Tax=Zemynaea arenosa TaxID=2561931 RepID=A0A4Y9SAK7_9BURK|nr:hypothetical protein [Massilia arenosa]TFW16610.1 hypothetical protein E4L96_16065 [Massilia arenosa]